MSQSSKQPISPGGNWKNILWREWRYSADEAYAQQIFNLVADQPVGWGGLIGLALLGTLYGQLAGLLFKLLSLNLLLPAPLSQGTVSLFVWLGGILGGVGALFLRGGQLSWRTWLSWLTPTAAWSKIAQSDRPNSEWWLGVSLGLARQGVIAGVVVGLLVAILLGRKYEVNRGNEYLAGGVVGAVSGALGALTGSLVGLPGGSWGAASGLALGIWAGAVWGSGLLGVLIGWLSILAGWLFFGVGDWLTGWLGLSLGYGLGTILNGVRFPLDAPVYKYRPLYFWWREQPLTTKVEAALRLAITTWPAVEGIWAKPLHYLEGQRKQPGQPELFIKALQSHNWLDRFAARHALVTLGGETTPALQQIAADITHPTKPLALWVLNSIEQDTTTRLVWRLSRLLCPHCLARFKRRAVDLPWGIAFTYYGCRTCGQSREFLEWASQVVAVLDQNWPELLVQQDDQFRVNWFKRRTLFDFDRVELIQAGDEEVERFAVQVGNDTDPYRKLRYQQMTCWIGPESQLSENTLRILKRMFGRVEINRLISETRK